MEKISLFSMAALLYLDAIWFDLAIENGTGGKISLHRLMKTPVEVPAAVVENAAGRYTMGISLRVGGQYRKGHVQAALSF
jgi:hypothetical protein